MKASHHEGAGATMAPCFESFANPSYPGHALSGGVICELYLTTRLRNLPHDSLLQTLYDLKDAFPPLHFTCDLYDTMFHTLAADSSMFLLDGLEISFPLFAEALDFYRESYGR